MCGQISNLTYSNGSAPNRACTTTRVRFGRAAAFSSSSNAQMYNMMRSGGTHTFLNLRILRNIKRGTQQPSTARRAHLRRQGHCCPNNGTTRAAASSSAVGTSCDFAAARETLTGVVLSRAWAPPAYLCAHTVAVAAAARERKPRPRPRSLSSVASGAVTSRLSLPHHSRRQATTTRAPN
jgi:hypothetical protein